jgi:hypothetical protein
LADELFASATVACALCGGTGLSGECEPAVWSLCPSCGGRGSFLAIPPEEFAALRQRVLAAFPDADAPAVPDGPGSLLVQHLKTGSMEALEPADTPLQPPGMGRAVPARNRSRRG